MIVMSEVHPKKLPIVFLKPQFEPKIRLTGWQYAINLACNSERLITSGCGWQI